MITLELDLQIEKQIIEQSQKMDISISEFVHICVTQFLQHQEETQLFGNYGSGQDNLSTDRKTLVKQKLQAKHNTTNL